MLTRISRRAAVDHADAAAFVAPAGWSISYAELDRAADEAAAGLSARGLGQGSVLALLMGSVVDYVVLYLAAARLGAVTAGVNPRLRGREIGECLDVLKPDLVIAAAELATQARDLASQAGDLTAQAGDLAAQASEPAAQAGGSAWRLEVFTPGHDAASAAGAFRLADAEPLPELPEDPERPVCVCFTSGSTGTPKGAWFANRQLEVIAALDTGGAWDRPATDNAASGGAASGNVRTDRPDSDDAASGTETADAPDDTAAGSADPGTRATDEASAGGGVHGISSTALAHVGFMTKLGWMLASGRTTHLLKRWSAGPVLELISRRRMRALTAVAPQIALMLRHPSIETLDFSAVEAIVVGGALSPGWMVQQARQRFGAGYSIRYSSTESGGIGLATALDAEDAEALHTIGRPRPGVEAEVRSAGGTPLPAGEVGELWLRSGAVMSGYWNDPAGSAAALVDGWLRTGDLAALDASGCFRLAGRVTEMFIRGGYNVYPAEVEAILGRHRQVAEIAVVPRPDPVMGEIGVAVVVAGDAAGDDGDDASGGDAAPLTLQALRDFGADELAAFKLPEALLVVDSLPRNSADKIDRRALQKLVLG